MRTTGWVAVICVSFLQLCGCATILQEPRFTSFSGDHPPAREGYPPTVPWGTPAPVTISGYDLLWDLGLEPGEDQVIVQRLVSVGARDVDCDGVFEPIISSTLEYFDGRGTDLQSSFFTAEQRRWETRRAWATTIGLPGVPPSVPEAQHAVILGSGYFRTIGEDAARQLIEDVVDGALVRWHLEYDYDGCHGSDASETGCAGLTA